MSRSTWYSSHSLGCGSRAGGRGTCSAASRHSRPFSQDSTASPAAYLRARAGHLSRKGVKAVGYVPLPRPGDIMLPCLHRIACGMPARATQPSTVYANIPWTAGSPELLQLSRLARQSVPLHATCKQSSHRMGSCSWTSRKVRPLAAAPAAPSPLASLAPSTRSCCSSFRLSERPVPSYLAR